MWTLLCGVVTIAIFLALWSVTPSYTENEPKPVPHSLPVLGLALSYAKDRRSLYRWANAISHRQPFSMFIAGRKHYVIHRPSECSAVFRNSRSLDSAAFLRMVFMKLFRFKKSEADRFSGELRTVIHDMSTELLLRPENNEVTATKYFVDLDAEMQSLADELTQSPTGTLIRDTTTLVAEQLGNPSLTAYFSRKLVEDDPAIITDLQIFNKEGLWPLLFGMPPLIYPRPHAAIDRIMASMSKFVNAVQHQKGVASPYVETRVKTMADKGVSNEGLASDMFAFIFGLLSNSNPTAYCALLHMIAEPNIIPLFREELSSAGYPDLQPSQYHTIIPKSVPRMRAFLQESFRMHSNTVPIREVLEDTTLTIDGRTWDLKKGGVVNMANALMNESDELHTLPHEFIAERFLDTNLGGLGENFAKTTRVFGGGVSYCPGRVFAEKQIIGFLAELCMRFDLRIVTPGYEIPRNSDFDYVLACPVIEVEISRRASAVPEVAAKD